MKPIEVPGIELVDATNELGVGEGARVFFVVRVLETEDGGEIDSFEIEEIWPAIGVECLDRPATTAVMAIAARVVGEHIDESADYYVNLALHPYAEWED